MLANTQIQTHVSKYTNNQHKKVSDQLFSARKDKTFNFSKDCKEITNIHIHKTTSSNIQKIFCEGGRDLPFWRTEVPKSGISRAEGASVMKNGHSLIWRKKQKQMDDKQSA